MDLILWRHAEAHVLRDGQDDLERALTPKGERQAQRMADWLNQRLAHSTRILVSPSLRTQQTAKALDKSFKTLPALAPAASAARTSSSTAKVTCSWWPTASSS
jgi:phosphohistidine phosphatase